MGLPEPTRPEPTNCECCKRNRNPARSFSLDHDHPTGKFRGWLCYSCNSAIGKLGDNLAGLMRAVEYLRRFECVAKARRPFAFRAQRYAPVGK
jgi:hypothetical protein